SCTRRLSFTPGAEISSGVLGSSGWKWIELNSTGAAAFKEENELTRRRPNQRPFLSTYRQSVPAFLSVARAGYAVTIINPPLTWTVYSRDDSAVIAGRTPDRIVDSTSPFLARSGSIQPLWVANGWVDLGDAFLEVIADLRSDGRRLLLFDSNGSLR